MSYRQQLPQLEGGLFLTDGGIETTLIFHRGLDLPLFAAFDLLKSVEGIQALREYYVPYLLLARERDLGFVLESPTWRANLRWAQELGYSIDELDTMNRKAIELMEEIRSGFGYDKPCVISGCIGPHDDGYRPSVCLSAQQAEEYHSNQIRTFSETSADMVTAITMTYPDEAIGIAEAAAACAMPVAISFTLETDGRLPNGQALGDAIQQVDEATHDSVAYYMINCAHPTHFERVLDTGEPWRERLKGLRANASTKSHAELDEAEDLDEGDPTDLARRYAALRESLPNLNVLGGCCGTDDRHVAAIGDACRPITDLAAGSYLERINGVELHFEVAGSGPVCIFQTPGWGPGLEMYRELSAFEEVFTMVYLETRGSGGSERAEPASFTFENLATDVEELRKFLGVDSIVAMGHSFGGALSLEYGLRFPKSLRGLVLIDAVVAEVEEANLDRQERVTRLQGQPGLQDAMEGLGVAMSGYVPESDEDFGRMLLRMLPLYFVDQSIMERFRDGLSEATWSHDAFRGSLNLKLHDLRPRLSEIHAPAVVAVGSEDFICGPIQARWLGEGLSNSVVVEIDGAGHFPWVEAPTRFFPRTLRGIRELSMA